MTVETNGQSKALTIPAKTEGLGSSVNGGELLALALATCYCNDVYREAASRGIRVESVSVEVDAEFGGPGEPAKKITYRAKVEADASPDAIRELLAHTDRVAEVHNTLRSGIPVVLEAIS